MAVDLEAVSGRPIYRYYVAWTISGDIALELDLKGVSFTKKIRKAGEFSGAITYTSANDEDIGARSADKRVTEAFAGTMPGKMSLFVTRNNKPMWGGYISRRTYDPASRTLTINATGFEAYLYRRHIWHDLSYPVQMDQYDLVRNLMSTMRSDFQFFMTGDPGDIAKAHPDSADIGILVSDEMSGKHQDIQSWSGGSLQNYGDALEQFSDNLGGFEYNIVVGWNTDTDRFTKTLTFRDTPPSQIRQGQVYTGERPGIDQNYFEYPGNVLSVGYDDGIDDTVTRYYVTGKAPDQAETPTQVVTTTNEDGTTTETTVTGTAPPVARVPRGVYENEPYLSTQWPLFESIESSAQSDVASQDALNAYAKSYGERLKPPGPTWTVTVNGAVNPQVGDYVPGDWCTLVMNDAFMNQAILATGLQTEVFTKRIGEFSVTVTETSQIPEVVTLTLIDEWMPGGA